MSGTDRAPINCRSGSWQWSTCRGIGGIPDAEAAVGGLNAWFVEVTRERAELVVKTWATRSSGPAQSPVA